MTGTYRHQWSTGQKRPDRTLGRTWGFYTTAVTLLTQSTEGSATPTVPHTPRDLCQGEEYRKKKGQRATEMPSWFSVNLTEARVIWEKDLN